MADVVLLVTHFSVLNSQKSKETARVSRAVSIFTLW